MSTYRRAATRVVVLCTLIAGFIVLAEPTPASAFTCAQNCNAAYISCLQFCQGDFGCQDQCGADRAECLSAC